MPAERSSGGDRDGISILSDPVRGWFVERFPKGPTAAQSLGWPIVAQQEHTLLISPTGSGKTLAAFLAILDRLIRDWIDGRLERRLRCVYVSPLRSLGYDVERNLKEPLEGIRQRLGLEQSPIKIGVRTGDTSAYHRRKLLREIPHILITTPESLSLLLSQAKWIEHWKSVEHLIVDEVHAVAPTKRGADLACSLERLADDAERDPGRVGLSATCRPADRVARFLTGPTRSCRILEVPSESSASTPELKISSLLRGGEAPHRGLTYRRLLRRLRKTLESTRTTVVFANTRAFAEKLTHDLVQGGGRDSRREEPSEPIAVATHHSALDARRRREVEAALKEGSLRSVVTSTSLELGVDIGSADQTVQIGLPGGVSRYLQRVGRSGHGRGLVSRGIIFAATPAEVAGAIVTTEAALDGRIEPITPIRVPLDVLCQQLVGMACAGERSSDACFALLRRAESMAMLTRSDFDACLASLAGELTSPAGAFEPEPGSAPRWTSPRIWKRNGWFGVRHPKIVRWFRMNVGTISAEESVPVIVDNQTIGTVELSYADRLLPGDRFVLDGRALVFRRLSLSRVLAEPTVGEPSLPRWSSDRQGLSAPLAIELAAFRAEAARRFLEDGPAPLRAWLVEDPRRDLDPEAAQVLIELLESQERFSEVPRPGTILVEESPVSPHDEWDYTFHAPLNRNACEAMGRAIAARLGRRLGRDLTLQVADLGWSIRVPDEGRLDEGAIQPLLDAEGLEVDVLDGLERGDLMGSRFRNIAATALMVLRNHEPGRKVRVGGLNWVGARLYPLIKAACPDHPLLRETKREMLEDVLDLPQALHWLSGRPALRFRRLSGLSPFAQAWIAPGQTDGLAFETQAEALRRLHARLMSGER